MVKMSVLSRFCGLNGTSFGRKCLFEEVCYSSGLDLKVVFCSIVIMSTQSSDLECHRCGNTWNYSGSSDYYASCPNCKTSVKIPRTVEGDTE
jgi:Zn finger protein HypA/HybF involved in hydrogenase expression